MALNEENERLYNVRAAIPEHAQVFARWAADSEKARDELQNQAALDISYGPHERQKLDLFRADDGQAPLYVFLHGGYWQAMDKSFSSFLAPAYLRAGCSLAIINYRLCPNVRLCDIVEDAVSALIWLAGNSRHYDGKNGRMHLVGHSAGGHLAAMMLTRSDTAPLISSITALSGLFDLRPLVSTSLNDNLGLDEEEAVALSPAFLSPRADVPLHLFAGERESAGFHDQCKLMADKWSPFLTHITNQPVLASDHLSIIDRLPQLSLFP